MPMNTNLKDLGQDSSNSSKSNLNANISSSGNGNVGKVSEANKRPSTSVNFRGANNEGPKIVVTVESKRCVNMALQQQVSEKLKTLSKRLKKARSQQYEEDQSFGRAHEHQQQQPISSAARLQNALIATNPKTIENEKTKKDKPGKGGAAAAAAAAAAAKPTTNKPPNRQEHEKKSRQQLEAEINALHKLVDQLSLENPNLRPRIASIANQLPALKQTDILKRARRLEAGQDHAFNHGPSTSRGISDTSVRQQKRSHFVSEERKSKSCQSIYEENEPNDGRPRKRGKRGDRKRKVSNKQKCLTSEMRDLAKYINNIVDEYLVKNEAQLGEAVRAKLKQFDGDFNDLGAYATHLVELGLGRIVEDELRVNRKNNRQAFITMSTDREALERDGMIMMPVARRYAFEGDIVRAFVLHSSLGSDSTNDNSSENTKTLKKDADTDEDVLEDASESLDSDIDSNELDTTGPSIIVDCPKAFVIEILKHTDNRKAVGSISFRNTTQLPNDGGGVGCVGGGGGGGLFFKFIPLDTRMPLMYVPEAIGLIHAEGAKTRNDITDLLYLAQVCETDVNGHCIAELLEKVGKVGHLEHELKAILMHNGFKDIKPYEQRFEDLYGYDGLPKLTDIEWKQREDLRSKCIFTIDPPTARDLDDALSIDEIGENEYDIGVHIADVAYFLEENSELDDLVKSRATSIYLVNEVIHMLPVALCFKCSLIPGEDKLAFSVFWRMNRDGQALGPPRFSRSIVNSCTKFAYGHAQKLIENPNAYTQIDDFPDIHNGFTLSMLADRVQILHEMSQKMRRRRYDNGALSINNPKLRFELDPLTGEPISFDIDSQRESNYLIEEFMLLANMSVAKHIYEHFPNISLLRNHAPPLMTSMKNLHEKLSNNGINLDYSSSKAIYLSMQRICSEAEDTKAMIACLSTLLTKPMARAKYICSDGKTNTDLCHYALSIPIYTHFTSPIRRYPDILVHRLLAATLGYCSKPKRTPDELTELAKLCNLQKLSAKNASDESALLYFKRYVKAKQGITLRAAVVEIHKHLLNVVTVLTGHVFPILYKAQKVIVDTADIPHSIIISEKGSRQPPLKLQLFSSVDIKLVVRDEKIMAFFVSPDLRQRQINCIEKTKNTNPKNGGKSARQDQRPNTSRQQQNKENPNSDRAINPQPSEAHTRKREQEVIVSQVFQSIKQPPQTAEETTQPAEQQKR